MTAKNISVKLKVTKASSLSLISPSIALDEFVVMVRHDVLMLETLCDCLEPHVYHSIESLSFHSLPNLAFIYSVSVYPFSVNISYALATGSYSEPVEPTSYPNLLFKFNVMEQYPYVADSLQLDKNFRMLYGIESFVTVFTTANYWTIC